ncbi:MAG: phosphate ABC transporter ATP-binding protein [Elainellaceae cyanobacterium]
MTQPTDISFGAKLLTTHDQVPQPERVPVDYLNDSVIKTRHLGISYHSRVILEDVNLDIYRQQLTCFIGPSGCGKSSLIRCFNRLNDLIATAKVTGKIWFNQRDLYSFQEVTVRRAIGMVFQRPNPFPKSVYENIALGLRINGYRGDIDERVERSLRQVGLWDEVNDDLKRNALHLSVGQQQRLCIARAIALGAELILMDEPCSALDPISSKQINKLLKEMKKHYTIIVVTHNLRQAANIADWVAFFNVQGEGNQRVGKLIEVGSVPEIFVNPKHQATHDYIHHQTFSTE